MAGLKVPGQPRSQREPLAWPVHPNWEFRLGHSHNTRHDLHATCRWYQDDVEWFPGCGSLLFLSCLLATSGQQHGHKEPETEEWVQWTASSSGEHMTGFWQEEKREARRNLRQPSRAAGLLERCGGCPQQRFPKKILRVATEDSGS